MRSGRSEGLTTIAAVALLLTAPSGQAATRNGEDGGEAPSEIAAEAPEAQETSTDAGRGDRGLSCAQIKAEAAAQEREIEAAGEEIMKVAGSQMGGGSMAGQLAGQALSGVASMLLPGVGGLIGAGVQAAQRAAQQAQISSIQEKAMAIATRQQKAAMRIQRLDSLHAARCGSPLPVQAFPPIDDAPLPE
ncbi:hypothetical protein [Sphingomonas cavernae]|uniref:Uncharacterized protein n=1 Tax=Sphingomonas cavernae TaxID=2320861 RepID=A0A418W7X7_9SPHN|nr:hypothetical protein [Sphingomonas cavernae]RJF86101.1 hypothetical protein D3876_19985 [Sphingomonas cavernae]